MLLLIVCIKKRNPVLQNLLKTLKDWTGVVDLGHGVDVVYLEAFNSVPHQRLLQKLAIYGFGCQLFCWLKGFSPIVTRESF